MARTTSRRSSGVNRRSSGSTGSGSRAESRGPVESIRRKLSDTPSWVFIALGVAAVVAVAYAAGWNDDIEDVFEDDFADEDDDSFDDETDYSDGPLDEPGNNEDQNFEM